MLSLRRAEADDSKVVWLWRNDEAARAASINEAPVPWDDHERWFSTALSDPTRALLIALDKDDGRVGMVRFDFGSTATAIVSINVAPERRGIGVGRSLLHAALDWIVEHQPGTTVTAVVRSSNAASLRLFKHEGFVLQPNSGDFATLTITLGDLRI